MTPELAWYWHRLRAMSPGELAGRAWAVGARWAYPVPVHRDQPTDTDPVGRWPMLEDRSEAPAELRDRVAEEASRIRSGRWLVFGWREIVVSTPPDWERDYLADALTGENRPAETRNVWEINRWSEMVVLTQNAWLNQRPEDARLAQEWLNDWCDRNPRDGRINWKSPLEGGLRLINFAWIDTLVRACGDGDLTTAQSALARRVLPRHAWWVWRHRSRGSSANNHLLGELAGLVVAARRWPWLASVAAPAERLWSLLASEILQQFAADGGNREQALHYHQFAWELAWQAHLAMGGSRLDVADRLREAARFYCDVGGEAETWDFGDSDDGQVTPLVSDRRRSVEEWRGWWLGQKSGAALRFWLGSPPNVSHLASTGWRVYPSSGQAVQTGNGWKARLDGSPLGWGRLAAHGHLDAMHLSLWLEGAAVIVDPGTGAYRGDPRLRARLAGWEMHNGAVPVASHSDPRRAGAFLWRRHHPPPHVSVQGRDCVVRLILGGRSISRSVCYQDITDEWRVTDMAADEGEYVVRWRLAPGWAPAAIAPRRIVFARSGVGSVELTVSEDAAEGCELGEGEVSRHFGGVQRAPVVAIRFRRRLVSHWKRLSPEPAP
jgi:hypothetical protein